MPMLCNNDSMSHGSMLTCFRSVEKKIKFTYSLLFTKRNQTQPQTIVFEIVFNSCVKI